MPSILSSSSQSQTSLTSSSPPTLYYSTYRVVDPMAFKEEWWPDVYFYDKQVDVIYSVVNNIETFVPAGNKLGKDFVTAFICLYFFLTRNPVRIVTTSAKDDHLRVLWGEINRFIDRCKTPLNCKQGGPLIINHQDIHKIVNGRKCPISYMKGAVASADSVAAMGGHHANPDTVELANDGVPRTLFVGDECSSVPDMYYPIVLPWSQRRLFIGNTWQCENFWKRGVEGGDIVAPNGQTYYRKVIRIEASDSPNVRLGLAQIAAGLEPTNEIVVPGVKPFDEYQYHVATWDDIQKCVALNARFYKGSQLFLYPPAWLAYANEAAKRLSNTIRKARAMGVDPAEGGDQTAWTIIDNLGVLQCVSLKTPNTTDVTAITLALMREWQLEPEQVMFDRGGGGKEHADRLALQGYKVRTVGFGEQVTLDIKRVRHQVPVRQQQQKDKYAYKNRRAEMAGELHILCDPSINPAGFAIGAEHSELLRQMGMMPKWYDEEGRLYLPPKRRKSGDADNAETKKVTLDRLLGCSPDIFDSLCLAVHTMLHKKIIVTAGPV